MEKYQFLMQYGIGDDMERRDEKLNYRQRVWRFYTSKIWLGNKEEGRMRRSIAFISYLMVFCIVFLSVLIEASWPFLIFGIPLLIVGGSAPTLSFFRWKGTRGRLNWRYWDDEYWESLKENEDREKQ